jgi:hypothetical protein
MSLLEIIGALTLTIFIIFAILFTLNIVKIEKMAILVEDADTEEVVGYTMGLVFFRGGNVQEFEED